MKKVVIYVVVLSCVAFNILPATANPSIVGQVDQKVLLQVRALLDTPEDRIDFAHAKLTMDKIIDPRIDLFREKNRLLRMVDEIKQLGNPQTSLQKKDALKKYLYDAGDWNNNRAFGYDFNDPLGKNIPNKLISNYMNTRKGNCVSMPFLFIVLGQKLGLDVTASVAPLHVFVKYKDEKGNIYNLETTSGANIARDRWYKKQFPISQRSVKNGIYLKTLTKKQTLVVMASVLLEHFHEKKQFGQVIALADVLLDYYNVDINSLIFLASAHNELLKQHGVWQYYKAQDVPVDKRHIFSYLLPRVNWYHMQAEKLGWRQLSNAENEAYIEAVNKDAIK